MFLLYITNKQYFWRKKYFGLKEFWAKNVFGVKIFLG